jgi:Probable sensor domain DACNV
MQQPVYPTPRGIAQRLETYFAELFARCELRPRARVEVPDAESISAIIEAGFWASLKREEGYPPKISLAYISPESAALAMRFERPLELAARPLVKLAPAVERPEIHLGIWPGAHGLTVWGTTRAVPPYCFVLEVVAPGLLVVKHRRRDSAGKYVNIAVFEGDQLKLLDLRPSQELAAPRFDTALLRPNFDPDGTALDVLVQLAASMRTHGRGGSLLVVPAGEDRWLESIVRPIAYAVAPPFTQLADLLRADPTGRDHGPWSEAFAHAVSAIAGLTAVDGATVINADCEVLAFGAKIARPPGAARVEQVVVTEPVEGAQRVVVHPTELGGTRHLSGAQFVQDQPDAIAMVASQDGRFTVFAWSAADGLVIAHRVDTLLL